MKNFRFYIYVLSLLSSVAMALSSCSTDDSEIQWGLTKVYMPQAAILDGGLTNNYPVPLGNNASTNNYKKDSADNHYTLKITLGVYRSGLQDREAFSVKVAADAAATQAALSGVPNSIALPEGFYTLPTDIAVPQGERQSTFYLDVDVKKLIEEHPDYGKKKIVLVVALKDLSRYELNEALSKTTVVIDGPSFMPSPKIVKGGDFGADAELYWTRVNTQGNLPASAAIIANGALVFDYGTTPFTATNVVCYYNPVQLENGKNYKFSCDVNNKGGTAYNNWWVNVVVTPVKPVAGTAFVTAGSACVMSLTPWTTNNKLTSPIVGTLPQNAGTVTNINQTTGVFKSNFSGDGYVVINVIVWSGTIGTISFDNVKIDEQ